MLTAENRLILLLYGCFLGSATLYLAAAPRFVAGAMLYWNVGLGLVWALAGGYTATALSRLYGTSFFKLDPHQQKYLLMSCIISAFGVAWVIGKLLLAW